jgi:hypothetical protein
MHAWPDRRKAYMEMVLNETCRRLPYGGNHELRNFVAARMLEAASVHQATFGPLGIIARQALADYQAGR